jgi:CelD/BcsL family acetyltransferase involved in cellulose biosynthesis
MLERFVTPLGDTRAVPDWWIPLFDLANRSSIFLSADWLQTWLDVYGSEFDGHWIRWEEQGAVVGGSLILLRSVRKSLIGIRTVYLNATADATARTPFAEFNDVLCTDRHTFAIAGDLARFLRALRWDRILLSGYEKGGVIEALIPLLNAPVIETDSQIAPYIDLAALGAVPLESSISANTRGHIRRSRRTYEQDSGPITLAKATSVREAGDFLDELAHLHNTRRNSKGEEGSFESNHVITFHRKLLNRLWDKACVDMVRLRAGSKDIGYLYNFLYRGKVYFFQSGFVFEQNQKLKPGLVMHAAAIDQYRADGQHEYDFLAGDSQYKRSLAKESRTLHWSVAFRGSLKMRTLLRLRSFVRMLRSR